jgi:tRNA A-37 threonylcarbamoyl transferase component Bud32
MSVPARATSPGDGVQAPVARARRRRRPSVEPPPRPRQLNRSGKFWLLIAGVAILFCVLLVPSGGLTLRLDEIEGPVLSGLSGMRVDWLTTFFRGLDAAIGPVVLGVWWGSLVVMLIWRRWRHLFVWIGTMWLVSNLTQVANEVIQRPRPLTVEILGAWQGFAMPSRPVAVLTATAVNVLYALVPAGRARGRGKLIAAGVVALVCAGRLYLAVDHPTDLLVAVALGVAIPLAGWRLLAPNDVFPVTYRRGRTAHLDVSGHRGEAIVRALHDQLGVVVTAVKPFGLEGSGGSTPLKMTVKGEQGETYLFGKLYAITHLRSDRWYKMGRTLLYGRLEDEKPFNTVRRLVQYEDYVLRLMHSAGLPVPEPYGFVEMTPEREYLLVTEFFSDAREVGDVDVDVDLIDQGLRIVRELWEAGLAHRDIKPANLLVRDGRLVLIDSAFAEVRPSPWRQAVDLGNMMLVLALRSDAKTVYDRARLQFSDQEIAEAFAATRGLTMPSQLRRMIRDHGRDLHAEFTRMLPERLPPIRIQRWTFRRVLLLLVVVVAALIASQLVIELLRSPL